MIFSIHFDDNLEIIRKFNPNLIISAIYFNKKENKYFIKRFKVENTERKMDFIPDDKNVSLMVVSIDHFPRIMVKYSNKSSKDILSELISCSDFVEVMNVKARGKRLNFNTIKEISLQDPLPYEEPEDEKQEELPNPEENDITESSERKILTFLLPKRFFRPLNQLPRLLLNKKIKNTKKKKENN